MEKNKIFLYVFFIIIVGVIIVFINNNVENDYSSIKYVNDNLSEIFSYENYNDYEIEQKKEVCLEKLNELESQDYIKDITYEEKNTIYEFKYRDGTYGGVMLEPFDKNCSGISKSYAEIDLDGKVKNLNNRIKYETSEYPYKENNLKAKFMYGLNYDDVYNNIKERAEIWNSEYLNTSIDDYCTVDDFKTGLDNYNFIAIEEHGSLYNNTPVICTQEIVSEENRAEYLDDLQNGNIVTVTLLNDDSGNSYYWIMPSFFESHYKKNELDDSIVYLGCCYGYANDRLVKSFENAGADCVIGSTDSVYTFYNTDIQDAFVYSLLCGDTASEALNYAKSIWGYNDRIWAEKYSGLQAYKPSIAEILIYCGNNFRLVNLIEIKEEKLSIEQALEEGKSLYNTALENYWGIIKYEETEADNMTIKTVDIEEDGIVNNYVKLKNISELMNNYTDKGFKQFCNEKLIKQINGEYYRLNADRGSDMFYLGNELSIERPDDITENRITFTSTEKFNDSDMPIKINKFVIVKEDEKWKIEEFILPN